jgi:hypothetical protein
LHRVCSEALPSTYIGLHQDYCVLCHNPDVQSMQSKIIFLVSEAFMAVLDCCMTYIAKRLFCRMLPHSELLSFLLHCINYLMLNKKLETS